jgi:hypothetical protein
MYRVSGAVLVREFMKFIFLLLAVFGCFSAKNISAQQSPEPPSSTSSSSGAGTQNKAGPQAPIPCSTKSSKLRPGFLIIGTVFDEHVLSLPGATLRIRCAEEPKYRWETVSNSRGEFAVRVPEGHSYEVQVRVKNYADQNVRVRTDQGDIQQRLSIRMQPLKSEKKGSGQ